MRTASRILDDEFGVPPSDETNALYDQIESGAFEGEGTSLAPSDASSPEPPSPPRTPPFQAPATQLHFVGRSVEIDQLATRLTAAAGNITVALVGMGGVGKSTLAAHLAHHLREYFADGVLWAAIAGGDPLDILGSWAQALGYDFAGLSDVENRATALRGVLADKRILIVLDDVRSVARARPLLVGGEKSATILTTRDLDIAAALNAQAHPVAEMTPQDGEQLLVRILGEERVHAEMDAARQICLLLQNLPLAVEIAAQRLRSRPRRRLTDMAARLQNIQERLDLAISDRAVRTSFMVSWESLDRDQQRAFALLGIFAGRSFSAPALAHIAELDLYTTEDRLFTLTALSLLSEEEVEDDFSVRYRQHPLVADFSREQLGDDTNAQLRMIHYYLAFVQEEQTNYSALQPEWGNLMAGLEMAHGLAEWQLVLDYADTLTEPWFTRARYTEARRAYAVAKEAAEALGNEQALAECLLRWGHACVEQNDLSEAGKLLLASRNSFVTHGNKRGQAEAEYYSARIHLEQGEYQSASRLLESSQQLHEQIEDTSGLATVYYQQSFLNYLQGQWNEARSLCTRALGMYELINHESGMVPALRLLTDIALELTEYNTATNLCERALSLCKKTNNLGELTATYYSMTVVTRLQGDTSLAETYAREALNLSDRIGNRLFKALALHELSRIYTINGDLRDALSIATDSLQLLQGLDDHFNQVYLFRHLGDVYEELGEEDKALSYWNEGHEIAREKQHPLVEELHQRVNTNRKSARIT